MGQVAKRGGGVFTQEEGTRVIHKRKRPTSKDIKKRT